VDGIRQASARGSEESRLNKMPAPLKVMSAGDIRTTGCLFRGS
jgi:hypothetical protein